MSSKEFSFELITQDDDARLGKIKRGDPNSGAVPNPDKIISLRSK